MTNIWAVCSYFNYTKSPYRIKNYKVFSKNLKKHGIKLLTVEFNNLSEFELDKNDADIIIQLNDGDIMWQKERLLNIGIDKLPEDTDIVLILDTDVVFSESNIISQITEELKIYKIVQCFSDVIHISPFVENIEEIDFLSIGDDEHYFFDEPIPSSILAYDFTGNFQGGVTGYAWAYRYDAIKNIKLYEHNIIGGGDRISASAFIGLPIAPPTVAGVNTITYLNYLNKVKNYGIDRNDIGFVDSVIYDLFHGFHIDRRYDSRHSILKNANFDSEIDLVFSEQGIFKFNKTVSQQLKNDIVDYFYSRNDI